MTRAKNLLETFTWNPDWGIKEVGLRKVKYPYGLGGGWHFKWKNIDMVLLRTTIDGGSWWVDEFFTACVIIKHNDVKSNDSIVSIYKRAVRILDRMGIDKVREQIHSVKMIDKIEYIDD